MTWIGDQAKTLLRFRKDKPPIVVEVGIARRFLITTVEEGERLARIKPQEGIEKHGDQWIVRTSFPSFSEHDKGEGG
jgi:hypothetical protein